MSNGKVSDPDNDPGPPKSYRVPAMATPTGEDSVAWYLEEWRVMRGWTLEELAERLDTGKGQVGKLERGDQRMNDKWMYRYSKAFGRPIGDLLHHPNDVLTPEEQMKLLPPAQRKKAHEYIELLAKDVGRKSA